MGILITGCARSGTSLTTQILKTFGANLGETNGLFENTDIRENVVKPYLRRIGADPLGQKPLPETLEPFPELREEVLKRLPGEPWAYKCAKATLMWPIWKDAFPNAKWVLVRRDAEKIADSCLRTPFMKAYDTKEGWMAWVREHERHFNDMHKELDIFEVRAPHTEKTLRELAEFTGLEFNPLSLKIFNPAKWHG